MTAVTTRMQPRPRHGDVDHDGSEAKTTASECRRQGNDDHDGKAVSTTMTTITTTRQQLG